MTRYLIKISLSTVLSEHIVVRALSVKDRWCASVAGQTHSVEKNLLSKTSVGFHSFVLAVVCCCLKLYQLLMIIIIIETEIYDAM